MSFDDSDTHVAEAGGRGAVPGVRALPGLFGVAKRQVEEDIVAGLLMEPGVDVIVIPNLYDLTPEGTGRLALEGISGNVVVLSWLYERAIRWTLDHPQRQTLWGHAAPKSWFEEGSPFKGVPVRNAVLEARPMVAR